MLSDLASAAKITLFEALGLTPEETLLIVVDEHTQDIGMAIHAEAQHHAGEVLYLEMRSREHDGQEPSPAVACAMAASDVLVLPTSKSLTHTQARINASAHGARGATMPGITPDIFVQLGGIDLGALVERTAALATVLRAGQYFHVTTSGGTDVTFRLENRPVTESTGWLRDRGTFGNLPSGEAYFAPADASTHGRIVIDLSMAGIGLVSKPIVWDVDRGRIRNVLGGDEARNLYQVMQGHGEGACLIGEFGIGTLPVARLVGLPLLDEKALGTCHFALGNNRAFGGTNDVDLHLDGIIDKPTITVDGVRIMTEGQLQL